MKEWYKWKDLLGSVCNCSVFANPNYSVDQTSKPVELLWGLPRVWKGRGKNKEDYLCCKGKKEESKLNLWEFAFLCLQLLSSNTAKEVSNKGYKPKIWMKNRGDHAQIAKAHDLQRAFLNFHLAWALKIQLSHSGPMSQGTGQGKILNHP